VPLVGSVFLAAGEESLPAFFLRCSARCPTLYEGWVQIRGSELKL
jgi:hypothetical protein